MKTRKEIEQEITDLVIKQLESGLVPWHKPWSATGHMPTSLTTGKLYGGINHLILSIVGQQYTSPFWVTYREAQKRGGSVNAGEKGTHIIKWSMYTRKNKNTGDDEQGFFLKQFVVFNLDQTTGVKAPVLPPPPSFDSVEDGLNEIINSYTMRPEIYHSISERAYYSPVADSIHLPMRDQFESAVSYAQTLAHELVHSTGHSSRLDRFADDESIPTFGSAVYAKEELVADLGGSMLLAHVGIDPQINESASYIAGWLRALKNDPTLILGASGKAQKAVDFIMGIKPAIVDVSMEEVEA